MSFKSYSITLPPKFIFWTKTLNAGLTAIQIFHYKLILPDQNFLLVSLNQYFSNSHLQFSDDGGSIVGYKQLLKVVDDHLVAALWSIGCL